MSPYATTKERKRSAETMQTQKKRKIRKTAALSRRGIVLSLSGILVSSSMMASAVMMGSVPTTAYAADFSNEKKYAALIEKKDMTEAERKTAKAYSKYLEKQKNELTKKKNETLDSLADTITRQSELASDVAQQQEENSQKRELISKKKEALENEKAEETASQGTNALVGNADTKNAILNRVDDTEDVISKTTEDSTQKRETALKTEEQKLDASEKATEKKSQALDESGDSIGKKTNEAYDIDRKLNDIETKQKKISENVKASEEKEKADEEAAAQAARSARQARQRALRAARRSRRSARNSASYRRALRRISRASKKAQKAELKKLEKQMKELEKETSSEKGNAGSRIVSKALSRIGCPYVWGACHSGSQMRNPNQRSFDCSGLVNWALTQAGKSRGSNTSRSYASIGKAVRASEMKPGDIVTFSGNGSASGVHHVGIYIGNGKMIHAPHSGSTVRVQSVTSGYYARQFYAARRV